MAVKYKLIQRKNPQKKDEAPKWFALPIYNGMIDLDFIAKQIAKSSSLTVGDIKNVLSNFLEEIPAFMLLGFSVKLDGLGTFRVNFSSEGSPNEKDFKANMMKGIRILFKPDPDMRKRILDELTYEKASKDTPASPEGGDSESPDEI